MPDPHPYAYNLGPFHRAIRTTSPACQIWFDRGLAWSYGFHHDEALRCFSRATAADPSCAMAWWGIAYAGGPNYNKPWERFAAADHTRALGQCRDAVRKALEHAATDLERALANAIDARLPPNPTSDYPRYNRAYAAAMAPVYAAFPDDLDVAVLYADSLMNLAPWQLWDLQTGTPRQDSQTLYIQSILERALPRGLDHPGLLHLYIHLMELSPTPEVAMPAADRLRMLVPDSGHLNHMPAHLDLLVGDYRRAIASNLDAIRADEKYMRHTSSTDFYTFYRLHDYTFPIYAAMFNGQYSLAIAILARMDASLTEDVMRVPNPPLIDWLEGFKSYRTHVLVRFGKWDEILALPFPNDRAFYCVTTTVLHYARGLAHSVLGNVADAERERDLFRTARSTIPTSRFEFTNTWTDILDVAEAMLTGELEYRRGDVDAAFASLRLAIHRADNLVYAEPWGWMQPPRHAYAALLLEQGRMEEAARVYAEDLGYDHSLPRAVRHPNNVWALHGYHECLTKLGRGAEARIVEPQLVLALAVADVSIESSCFCRRVLPASNETLCCE
ncbi:hypothetical protein Q5752_005869 [Cryptotrichosporon argae]